MSEIPSEIPPDIEWRTSDAPVPYDEALAFMTARAAAIRDGAERECVWLLEHPPLFTAGTSADPAELFNPQGYPVYRAGRGGWQLRSTGPKEICYEPQLPMAARNHLMHIAHPRAGGPLTSAATSTPRTSRRSPRPRQRRRSGRASRSRPPR